MTRITKKETIARLRKLPPGKSICWKGLTCPLEELFDLPHNTLAYTSIMPAWQRSFMSWADNRPWESITVAAALEAVGAKRFQKGRCSKCC